jgi:hypothetical protein
MGEAVPFHILDSPATQPLTKKFDIISPVEAYQWPVIIDYGAAAPAAPDFRSTSLPIMVGDVLHAIHQMMQTRLNPTEWEKLEDDGDGIEVAKAYNCRCKRVPGREEPISADGVKRVDYLRGSVMFDGLEQISGGAYKLLVRRATLVSTGNLE